MSKLNLIMSYKCFPSSETSISAWCTYISSMPFHDKSSCAIIIIIIKYDMKMASSKDLQQ